jgi:hypothetical protein
VESVELALPLAETVVEVPCQVQMASGSSDTSDTGIKYLKENMKDRI